MKFDHQFAGLNFVSDKRKAAVIKSSAASSQFPYPPAFRQPAFDNRYGNVPQGIPGLDLSNTDAQQENEGTSHNVQLSSFNFSL
jgi:hypothetical protein